MKKASAAFLILGVVLSFGLSLRIYSVSRTVVVSPLSRDAKQYAMYAFNLRFRHTYSYETGNLSDLKAPVKPDALRSPGYPFFLLPFTKGLPDASFLHRIYFAQAVLSTLTLLFAFFCFKLFLPIYWNITACLLIAISPHLITANSYILTEALFCFMIVIIGWIVSRLVQTPSVKMAVLTGMTMGMANLVRPSLLFFPVFVLVYLRGHFGMKKGLRLGIGFVLGFFLMLSPWMVRNLVTDTKVIRPSLSINFLHHGMYPDFKFDQRQATYGFPYRFDPRARHINKNMSSTLSEIIRRFRQEPLRHLQWYLLKKPMTFWSWGLIQGRDTFIYAVSYSPYFNHPIFQGTHFLMRVFHGGIVFLCMIGCIAAWLPRLGDFLSRHAVLATRFASLLLLYFTILHMIGAPFPRYAVPLRPYLYGMAVLGMYVCFRAIKERVRRTM